MAWTLSPSLPHHVCLLLCHQEVTYTLRTNCCLSVTVYSRGNDTIVCFVHKVERVQHLYLSNPVRHKNRTTLIMLTVYSCKCI